MTRGLGRRPASRARPRVVGADEGRIFEVTVRFADGGRLDAMREVGLAPGGVMDKSNVPSPEDKNSPGGDKTGHIIGVRAHTPLLNVDSNVDTSDNSSLMKKFTKPLKLAFKEGEEKKEEDENLD